MKTKPEKDGRSRAGLLLKLGADLSREGHTILQESAQRALAAAPEALKDPRWSPLPGELREDMEIQVSWASWIRAETHMFDSPGDDEAPKAEKAARRQLLAILSDRHPDQVGFRGRLEECMVSCGHGGLTPPTVKLMAASMALGLTPEKGRRP